jgi:hypothetical protein
VRIEIGAGHISPSRFVIGNDFEPVLARLVQVGVPRDLVHPRGKVCSRLKSLPVFQHSKKHFLHQVLTQSAIGGKPQEKVEEHAVMAVEQNADAFHVAVPNREHHQMIRLGFQLAPFPHRALHLRQPGYREKVTGKVAFPPICHNVVSHGRRAAEDRAETG